MFNIRDWIHEKCTPTVSIRETILTISNALSIDILTGERQYLPNNVVYLPMDIKIYQEYFYVSRTSSRYAISYTSSIEIKSLKTGITYTWPRGKKSDNEYDTKNEIRAAGNHLICNNLYKNFIHHGDDRVALNIYISTPFYTIFDIVES
jgi:hypothetical protein